MNQSNDKYTFSIVMYRAREQSIIGVYTGRAAAAAAVIIDTAGYQHDSLSSLPTAAATGELSIIGTGGGTEEVDKTIQSSRSVGKNDS